MWFLLTSIVTTWVEQWSYEIDENALDELEA